MGTRATPGPVPLGEGGSGASAGSDASGGAGAETSGGSGAMSAGGASAGGSVSAGGSGVGATGGTAAGGSSTGGTNPGGQGGSGAEAGQGGSGGTPDPCAGVNCNTPPANTCADATNLTVYNPTGTCAGGQCQYTSSATECAFGCANDSCTGDPCVGVSCNSPPANYCADTTTLAVYDAPGSCDNGSCAYSTHTEFCANGCVNGACMGDPCAGVSCNSPPASFCSGANDLTVYDTPGTCSDGSCNYGNHTEFCTFGCSGGSCMGDPCAGVTCNTPSANYCVDANTARVFVTPGNCIGGNCMYSHTDTPCAFGCVNGVCRDCAVDGDCGGGRWCNTGVCQDCVNDTRCGSSCTDCTTTGQVCDGSACIEPGCPPPTESCTTGSQNMRGCGNARIIGRTAAASGFVGDDDTCFGAYDDMDESGCTDGNADHTYRIYMRAGESISVDVDDDWPCDFDQTWWDPAVKLYTSAGCGDLSCSLAICDDDFSPGFNHTATYDGWYFIVVDGRSSFDDEGDYKLNVTLTCLQPGCEC